MRAIFDTGSGSLSIVLLLATLQLVVAADWPLEFAGPDETQLALAEGRLASALARESSLSETEGSLSSTLLATDGSESGDLVVDDTPTKRQMVEPSASSYYFYDLNTHLPSNNPFEHEFSNEIDLQSAASSQNVDQELLSPPVNDPLEFDTNQLESGLPTNQALLMGLLANASEDQQDGLARANSRALASYLEEKLRELEAVEAQTKAFDAQPADNEDNNQLELDQQRSGSEYIDQPLALNGHQFVQGGAGEGRQLLGPEGTFENVQVIKTDSAVPAYCEPPNPCPLGYSARDGCLEQFVNSASFSRDYQAKQKCSCDNEHSLFNCAAPPLPAPKLS